MSSAIIDVRSFKEFLRDRARETWAERKIPYYLSVVGTELDKKGVNYREFTGALRLAQWASVEAIPETKLITHPNQKAKIGLLPSDVSFNFDDEEENFSTSPVKVQARHRKENPLVDFVQTLSVLPDDVLEKYQVPAKVLVAFLKP